MASGSQQSEVDTSRKASVGRTEVQEKALLETDCPDLKLVARGKVRDIYAIPGHDDRLLFVATDRVSAFDHIMKNGIPGKGRLLTELSLYFFDLLCSGPDAVIPSHVLARSLDDPEVPGVVRQYRDQLDGRSILVKRCEVVKCEAIVRGYLTGSAFAEYEKTSTVHGIQLEKGLKESSKFPEPLFTPSTKADVGEHDENIHPDSLGRILGDDKLATSVSKAAVNLYSRAAAHALPRGLILADTKFEFGLDHSTSPPTLTLVDECLTPDSSRFWPADQWREGKRMTGVDKQVLREWLKVQGDIRGGVAIPPDVVDRIWASYLAAFRALTGRPFA